MIESTPSFFSMRMTMPAPICVIKNVLRYGLGSVVITCLLFFGCAGISFHPAPVVPTKQHLPYSAQVRLVELGVYAVEPGATMRTDPQLQNFVIHASSAPNLSQKQWEKAVLDYLTARQTFR